MVLLICADLVACTGTLSEDQMVVGLLDAVDSAAQTRSILVHELSPELMNVYIFCAFCIYMSLPLIFFLLQLLFLIPSVSYAIVKVVTSR